MILIELTPGPNMGYLAIVGSRWGRGAGLATIVGVTTAFALYLLAASVGLTEILLLVPSLYQALQWAGIGYIAWLAVDTWRARPEGGADGAAGDLPAIRHFLRGLMTNLLNPKAAVFYIALLPGFTNPRLGHLTQQVLWLGGAHILISVLIHTAIVLTAAQFAPALSGGSGNSGARRLQRGFALALGAVAVWLAWETLASR